MEAIPTPPSMIAKIDQALVLLKAEQFTKALALVSFNDLASWHQTSDTIVWPKEVHRKLVQFTCQWLAARMIHEHSLDHADWTWLTEAREKLQHWLSKCQLRARGSVTPCHHDTGMLSMFLDIVNELRDFNQGSTYDGAVGCLDASSPERTLARLLFVRANHLFTRGQIAEHVMPNVIEQLAKANDTAYLALAVGWFMSTQQDSALQKALALRDTYTQITPVLLQGNTWDIVNLLRPWVTGNAQK